MAPRLCSFWAISGHADLTETGRHWVLTVGMPRHIVFPPIIEIVIQKHRREQTKINGTTGFKLLNDLPGRKALFMGIRPGQVEVVLIERRLSQELGARSKRFQVIELIFDEAVNGFDVARVGGSGGRDARMLAVTEGGGEAGAGAIFLKLADELAAVIGLPGEVTEFNAATGQVSLNAGGEAGAGGSGAAGGEGEERQAAAHFAGGVLNGGPIVGLGLRPVGGRSSRSLVSAEIC